MTLSTPLARALKEAGLQWQPQLHDFFMIPDVGMESRHFVLADMMAQQEVLKGKNTITFNGVVEWALDFVWIHEAVWLPTESQLRELLAERIGAESSLLLRKVAGGYQCEIIVAEDPLVFGAATAVDAYAKALLAWLQRDE